MTDLIDAQVGNAESFGEVAQDDNTTYTATVPPDQIEKVRAYLGDYGVTYGADGTITIDRALAGAPDWNRVRIGLGLANTAEVQVDDDVKAAQAAAS